ncbi:hypothetical protein V8G54_012132 [Vigna mungo]|uniref:STT3/PglB/AglB core domain-containing protein n=1 Tax=Vigna mungo TaxID=3915 RepID=A0AAQ3S3I6_VIGMU
MSWWDYGYQITAMGNRTVIVDNNTWNNTHIATVGRAMSSYEDEAYEIMRSLDVDYVLVVFGGVTGYSSDDINKYDRARGVEIGNKDIKLEYLEEAFTTQNWIVRIYKVKPPKNRW